MRVVQKRKQQVNVRRIRELRREVSRLKRALYSVKRNKKRRQQREQQQNKGQQQKQERKLFGPALPTLAQLLAAAPSVSIAVDSLTRMLGKNYSQAILSAMGLHEPYHCRGSHEWMDQDHHPQQQVEQMSRILSGMFVALLISVISSFVACAGMSVLCLAVCCCRGRREQGSAPNTIIINDS